MTKLSEKQIDVITKTAVQTALEFMGKEKKRQEKQKHDRRLRNIKLLLKNYRSFVKHAEDIKLEINELDEKLELDELDTDEFKIQSIKKSKQKTLAMINFINKMLAVYKTMCDEDGSEAQRRYQVIKSLYIDKPKMTIKELSNVHFISERTIRRDRERAFESLAVLMFGVDAVRFK